MSTHLYARESDRLERRQLGNAWAVLGELAKGRDLCILTKGQFSLIDLVVALLDYAGPADVVVSTWTAAKKEIAEAARLLGESRIRSLRWLVDFSFCRRQPAYAAALRRSFGDGCIRSTKNHAKFLTVRNERHNVVVRTSMNLNKNARLEYLEVSDDAGLADFFEAVVSEMFELQAPSEWMDLRPSEVERQFEAFGVEQGTLERSVYGADLTDRQKPGVSRWP